MAVQLLTSRQIQTVAVGDHADGAGLFLRVTLDVTARAGIVVTMPVVEFNSSCPAIHTEGTL